MKKLCLFLLLSLSLLLLASCELFEAKMPEGKLRIVVYGNDYDGFFFMQGYPHLTNTLYGYSGSGYPSLNITTTVSDAVQMGNALSALAEKSNRDYEISYYIGRSMTYGSKKNPIPGVPDDSEAHVTISHDLSKDSLRSAFSSIVEAQQAEKDKGKDDVLIFFYSGHGIYDGKQGVAIDYGTDLLSQAAFILGTPRVDIDPLSAQEYETYGFDEFYQDLDEIQGKKILLVDCCYSGCLVPTDGITTNDLLYNESIYSLYKGNETSSIKNDIYVLTASEYFSQSYYTAKSSHSFFTGVLLESLGWDETKEEEERLGQIPALRHQKVTMSSLQEEVTARSHDFSHMQNSVLSGGSMDVVLFQF